MQNCNEVLSVKEKTLYCKEVDQNVFNISKTVRVTDNLERVTVCFVGRVYEHNYCEKLVIPEQFNVSQKEPVIKINGQNMSIDAGYVNARRILAVGIYPRNCDKTLPYDGHVEWPPHRHYYGIKKNTV